jgi:hypothetical protein
VTTFIDFVSGLRDLSRYVSAGLDFGHSRADFADHAKFFAFPTQVLLLNLNPLENDVINEISSFFGENSQVPYEINFQRVAAIFRGALSKSQRFLPRSLNFALRPLLAIRKLF